MTGGSGRGDRWAWLDDLRLGGSVGSVDLGDLTLEHDGKRRWATLSGIDVRKNVLVPRPPVSGLPLSKRLFQPQRSTWLRAGRLQPLQRGAAAHLAGSSAS
jgi:hypothetical protein